MAQFVRKTRLERKKDDQITKRTVVLGMATVLFLIFLVLLGLPLLVRLAVFLGDIKNRNQTTQVELVFPPLAPRLFLPFEATNSAKVAISGTAEVKTSVELLKGETVVEKKEVTPAGDFIFDVELEDGENRFTAVAIGDKGQRSPVAKDLIVVLDEQAPELVMERPSGDSETVDTNEYEVIGQGEKGINVTINGRMAMVDSDGKFRLKVSLASGKNELELIGRDLAGNETRKKVTITYDI